MAEPLDDTDRESLAAFWRDARWLDDRFGGVAADRAVARAVEERVAAGESVAAVLAPGAP